MSEGAEESSKLCTNCGLCCDGTLFDHVAVDDETERNNLSSMSFTFETKKAGLSFMQPCRALNGTICSVYELRPGICRRYRCHVLIRMAERELSLSEAKTIIAHARSAADRVAEMLGPDESIIGARKRWSETAEAWRANPQFHLRMVALNLILDKEFRGEHQRRLALDSDQSGESMPSA